MIFEYFTEVLPMKFIGSTWIIISSTQQTFQPDFTWEYLIKLEKLLAVSLMVTDKTTCCGVTPIDQVGAF